MNKFSSIIGNISALFLNLNLDFNMISVLRCFLSPRKEKKQT